jgi:thiamine biosynthesis protein ThiS
MDGLAKSRQKPIFVIPASGPEGPTPRRVKTGIQFFNGLRVVWIPAFAGMTSFCEVITMESAYDMWITLNGFQEELPEKSTVSSVIRNNQEFEIHMIVELNHRFIHQKDYEATCLMEGDVLELIHPAFGG